MKSGGDLLRSFPWLKAVSENLSHLSEVQDNKTHPVDKSWQVFLPVAAVRHLHDAEVHSTGKYWSHSAQSLFSDRQSADHKVRDN